MHTTATAQYNRPVLLGHFVTVPDGRRGTVEEINGSILSVEVAKPKPSPAFVIRSLDDVVEVIEVEAALVTHAA